jgi:hypothetical protein
MTNSQAPAGRALPQDTGNRGRWPLQTRRT